MVKCRYIYNYEHHTWKLIFQMCLISNNLIINNYCTEAVTTHTNLHRARGQHTYEMELEQSIVFIPYRKITFFSLTIPIRNHDSKRNHITPYFQRLPFSLYSWSQKTISISKQIWSSILSFNCQIIVCH